MPPVNLALSFLGKKQRSLRRIKFTAADSSVWVQEKDVWLCVLHTESISGDPFGQDKISDPGKPG
jgi:hypothetical protein